MASSPDHPGEAASPVGTMRAWTHSQSGLPDKILKLSYNLPIPILVNPTDVLVKISHASLNPASSIITRLIPVTFRTKPSIPESDFSGTVVKAGKGISVSRELEPGAAVFGSIPMGQLVTSGKGALAEYVVVPADYVCLKPDSVSFEQAAGLPIAGITALSVLDLAKLKPGYKVLVNGAAGGIGTLVVQLAKASVGENGKVVAICSARNFNMVKELGADEAIDYQEHAPVYKYLARKVDPFDVVLDCRGIQELFLHCPSYLKHGMPFVTVGTAPTEYNFRGILTSIAYSLSDLFWPRWLGGVDRPYLIASGFANLTDMERVSRLCAEGKLKVPIDSCRNLEDALKAYDVMLSRHARGKIVVKI